MIEKSFLQIDLLSERSDLKDLQFGLRFQICPGRIKVTQALRLRIQPNWREHKIQTAKACDAPLAINADAAFKSFHGTVPSLEFLRKGVDVLMSHSFQPSLRCSKSDFFTLDSNHIT